MEESTIYQYQTWQNFNANEDNNSNNNSDYSFKIHLHFRHVLALCYPSNITIPLNTAQTSHQFSRHRFLSHQNRQTTIRTILSDSDMGLPSHIIQTVTAEVSSFALDMVTNPCNADTRVLTMVLAILVVTPYDEREEIDRALTESLMQETTTTTSTTIFKPASKSSIDGLRRMILEGLCSVKECMVCLEELVIGNEVVCLPCGHVFHTDCIVRWLETSHLCPLCRFAMP